MSKSKKGGRRYEEEAPEEEETEEDSFQTQLESSKTKGPNRLQAKSRPMKSKKGGVRYEEEAPEEEEIEEDTFLPQQEVSAKSNFKTKQLKPKGPVNVAKRNVGGPGNFPSQPKSLPAGHIFREFEEAVRDAKQLKAEYQENENQNDFPAQDISLPTLPPITSIENIPLIFETKIRTSSIREFKNYFQENGPRTGKIHCDGNALVSDVHFRELQTIPMKELKKIRIRACPNISPFVKIYLKQIQKELKNPEIILNVELTSDPLKTLNNLSERVEKSLTKLEEFGPTSKSTISKALIYHANLNENSLLPSNQMLLNQYRKSENSSTSLIENLSVPTPSGQSVFLECGHLTLFNEFVRCFHPRVVFLIVTTPEDFLKCFFSLDCLSSFSILNHQQIRIVTNKSLTDGKLFSSILNQLEEIRKSAEENYRFYINDSTEVKNENDDFRRNHFLSSFLHLSTKCELLKEKLKKEHFLVWNSQDAASSFDLILKESMNFSTMVYSLEKIEEQTSKRLFETDSPMMNLADQITKSLSSEKSAVKTAQIYFSHKLIHGPVLHLHSRSNGKSFCVSDLQWFCRLINDLFNGQYFLSHRNRSLFVEQIKQRAGSNVRLVDRRGLAKLKLEHAEAEFLFWLLDSWHIAYSFAMNDATDASVYALFSSISAEPPLPLSTIWPSVWQAENFQSIFRFNFLYPCDSSILLSLYKIFPSQKILLASRDFLVVQDGAVEILVQLHDQLNKNVNGIHQAILTLSCRAVKLVSGESNSDSNMNLTRETFNYVVRSYYVLIWAYLFQQDYAFKIEKFDSTVSSESFDTVNGNQWMSDKWNDLALYHYSAAPTLKSPCSTCGLLPSVNKALYDACMILSPSRGRTVKQLDAPPEIDINEHRSHTLLFEHGFGAQFNYVGKHSLRPNGCNSFEVIILNRDKDNQVSTGSIISTLRIGCLVNNFGIDDDEKIFFEYGTQKKARSKNPRVSVKPVETAPLSHLDEIRNFGGLAGLKKRRNQSDDSGKGQEIYNGLRLRIDIVYTNKANMYELIFSINGVPWSNQIVRRKCVRTMFQPIVSSLRTDSTRRTVYLGIQHHRTHLDTALIESVAAAPVQKPWRVGMRLEAKDRKNPSILAIANIIEVYEDNRIRINFDGWTSTYDYTVEIDHPDLHPCGYWNYIQRVLYKNVNSNKVSPHFTFSRYDPPRGYGRSFSWRNYLTEINAEPIPFECFNYAQTEGMPPEFFPHTITDPAFTTLSCRHYYNARVKYHLMNTFIQNEMASSVLLEHRITGMPASHTTSPGIVILPTPISYSTLPFPCLKHFQDSSDVTVHMTCNHRDVSPWDQSLIISGSHLLDTVGSKIAKNSFSLAAVKLSMMTALDLARIQKHPIVPSISKLFTDLPTNLDKRMLEFYIRRWLELNAYIACFHLDDFFTQHLSENIPNNERQMLYTRFSVDINYQKNTDIKQETIFGLHGECYFCSLFRKNSGTVQGTIPFDIRIEIIDAYAPSIFYLELSEPELQSSRNHLVLDDSFFTRFTGLEIIDVKNIVIDRFEIQPNNTKHLKNLKYLALENNSLDTIDADFQSLQSLSYIKLLRNPLVSLPFNCFSSKALQKVEMSELGRLSEIDPNTRLSSDLKTFNITESILTSLPPSLGLDARFKLTKLTLNGVSWWRPDGMSVNEVIKYESFEKKFIPFLNSQELAHIYRMYDEDGNGVLSFSEINQMNAHIYRYIPRLKPTSPKISGSGRSSVEPGTTTELDNFKQDSFSLDPSGFPSAIFSLENLVELTIEYQAIKTVPDGIKTLKSLSIFNLNYCIELETISAEVGLLPLKELNLNGCLSLKTPPMEIVRRGHTQTMAFLQRLISGSTACKRTKLMLVGLGGAGKTSLVRAFLRSHSNSPPAVTDGIDIIKWKVPLTQENDFLEYSVWDFAGQSVYYHTHQFFLAKKAVYVLAWNIRLGAEHAGLDFWLSSICCHAPNAPIFVVGTHSDQVSRIDLRQDDLKRRYPQIVGFYNVSTFTGENVESLIDNIIITTLALPYMDEQIPRAWLSFENLISKCQKDVLTYSEVEEIAHNAGIFESSDVLQSVQFLHDLGSLQYFPSEQLKNYVVINPQWIVNVMACIVSIKDSPVKNGRLYHDDVGVIWKDYDYELHPWILKLTEAFDLTFPVPDQRMNLVPCLLPEEEPLNVWIEATESEVKELKVFYTFNYLPAGLFNRAQVRLFQFSDKSTIWRYGSLLVKNNHRAIIVRTDDRHITIKIQGIRPDNILFLIHEVFEGLVSESFFGVTYDINFPCPDCLESKTAEPWQFSSSLINRATELKSSFIQCHRFFHVASVTDLQALIPPDSNSNYDLHLEYSVRDLKSYRQNIAVDLVYLYSEDNIPSSENIELQVDPRKVKDGLINRGFKVWTPESMAQFKIENHYLVFKTAGIVLFGISTELAENPQNENLRTALQTIKDILRRPIIPIIYGSDTKWKQSELGVGLTDAFYVSMQNPKRYDNKLNELIELIEQIQNSDQKHIVKDEPTDVFISYCWTNSHDAASKGTKVTKDSLGWADPRVLKDYLESRGLKVWMDITRLGKAGVTQDIVNGLKNTQLVIACVSNEYTKSEMCRNEFLFAKNTLRLPVLLGIFGGGDEWRITEVGMCSLACPQVNFQFENPSAFEDIYQFIQSRLVVRRPTSAKPITNDVSSTPKTEKTTTAAYQELFELTQRKFLRLASGFAESMNSRPYPRVFAIDFIGVLEKSAQEVARIELSGTVGSKQDEAQDLEAQRRRDEEVSRQEEERKKESGKAQEVDPLIAKFLEKKRKRLCVRALCENEENWHPAGSPFEITEKTTTQNGASYFTRIMLLLKQSDLALDILNSEEGEKELEKLNEYDQQVSMEVKESYAHVRRFVMDCDEDDKYCGLKLCLMPSGKMLWLCEEHQNQPRVVLVTGAVGTAYSRPQAEEKSDIIKALNKLNERIAKNEIPPPELRVPSMPGSRRLSSEKYGQYSNRPSHRRAHGDLQVNPRIEENLNEDDQEQDEESSNQNNVSKEANACTVM